MRLSKIGSAFCLMTAFACAAALAGGEGKDSGKAEVKMMDTNGDGKISAEEHSAGARKMFQKMDADHDGMVSATEMDASHQAMKHDGAKPGKSSADKIKRLDTDGDGELSAKEYAAGSQKMFTAMDTDQDGTLTAAEIQAGHEKMMTAHDE